MLIIRSINPENEGKYFCRASNQFDSVSKETRVYVQQLNVNVITESYYEGDFLTLRCESNYSNNGNYKVC